MRASSALDCAYTQQQYAAGESMPVGCVQDHDERYIAAVTPSDDMHRMMINSMMHDTDRWIQVDFARASATEPPRKAVAPHHGRLIIRMHAA